MENTSEHLQQAPWNKGVIVGQKSPFKLKEICGIRVRLGVTPSWRVPCATWELEWMMRWNG